METQTGKRIKSQSFNPTTDEFCNTIFNYYTIQEQNSPSFHRHLHTGANQCSETHEPDFRQDGQVLASAFETFSVVLRRNHEHGELHAQTMFHEKPTSANTVRKIDGYGPSRWPFRNFWE